MSPPADRTKRTSISCDRCQKRKVKCQDPVPGPCRACRRGGHLCKVSRESRSRPFYQVSQEQFDLMIEVIKEYEPDLKLDLPSLRARKQARSGHNRHNPTTSGKCAECSRRMPTPPDEQIEQLEEAQETPATIDVSPEMEALDGESVSVLVDTEGSHKFIGPRGEASFHMAVVHCLTAERTTGNKFLLEHTTSPKSQLSSTQNRTGLPISPGLHPPDKGHLPSRAAVYLCAEKFFTQIQCSLWVYPEDQFYSRIEQTYSEESLKPTWFCFLYAFLSLTSPSEIPDSGDYPLTSEEYYNLSTSYLPLVLYHPDLDGVRGLLTLCMSLQRHRTLTPGYQLIGLAVRLAQSLGLHLDKTHASQDKIELQHTRRLWWSVYELEREICIKYGVPSAIVDDHCSASLPSENLLAPGLRTPVGYLSFSTSLNQLLGKVHRIMFITPVGPNSVSSNEKANVDSLLAEMTSWKDSLPQYLQMEAPSPPSHKRTIALLHLRYWSTRVCISRRFLLYHLQHGSEIPAEKASFFKTMASYCMESAEHVLAIMKALAADSLLSDLSFFDTNCLLSISLLFALSYNFTKLQSDAAKFRTCVGLFDLLKDVEWPAECVTRLLRIVRPLGLAPGVEDDAAQSGNQQLSEQTANILDLAASSDVLDQDWQAQAGDVSLLSNTIQTEMSPLEANVLMWDALGTWELPGVMTGAPWEDMSSS